ncbi:hypothetical protein CEP51_000867 [Fusarium floridanum]|uniref:Extracellular membrane protein CFEM domain-containing protein n=1 Tax=Fusarium floridanum TaxID=1325733 RepID=A0A428SK65_9HYPO|nr:hypothetical protein CEP51_000867 [Fusarium floridanum]
MPVNGGAGINATAVCNGGNLDRAVDTCISRECSGIERLKFAHVRGQMCDDEPDSKRNDHYVLLAAEIPAWISPWLRVFSSWATCSRLSLDDHVMVVCGLLYTVFATLVHLAWFVTADLTTWDTTVQNVTDGLKIVYIAEVFELACLCLSRVVVLLRMAGESLRVELPSVESSLFKSASIQPTHIQQPSYIQQSSYIQ